MRNGGNGSLQSGLLWANTVLAEAATTSANTTQLMLRRTCLPLYFLRLDFFLPESISQIIGTRRTPHAQRRFHNWDLTAKLIARRLLSPVREITPNLGPEFPHKRIQREESDLPSPHAGRARHIPIADRVVAVRADGARHGRSQ